MRAPQKDLQLNIGTGEDEAISLAAELGDAALLTDDRRACIAARHQGLTAFGTLTILDLADEAGLIEFEEVVGRLRKTSFYVADDVLGPIVAAIRSRKRRS